MAIETTEPTRAATLPQPPHPALRGYYDDEPGRRRRLRQWFDGAAQDYDRINAVMSLGSGVRYRDQALRRLGVGAGQRLLDVGAGTGVITALAQQRVGPQGLAVALDPSPGMLGRARDNGVTLTVTGLGERLPFADAGFDALTMGFALRHVADLTLAFAEYARVLRPGGRLLLLEISRPSSRVGRWLLWLYMGVLVPRITRWLQRSTQSETLMRYYWDTIDQCVPPQTILERLSAAGFGDVHRSVWFGIFSEYSAVKAAQGDSGPARSTDKENMS